MQRCAIIILAGVVAACSSSPTQPTPIAPIINNVPAVTAPTASAPEALMPLDGRFDLAFYSDFALGQFSYGIRTGLRRLTNAPRIFLNTHDLQGTPIPPATLDVVSSAMISSAGTWSGSRFGLAAIELAVGTRANATGWLTVVWDSSPSPHCGTSNNGVDGGVITFYYKGNCGCGNSLIRAAIAKHEIGHAFGYYHTRNADDVMTSSPLPCDREPSDRERYHAMVAYSRPIGSFDP